MHPNIRRLPRTPPLIVAALATACLAIGTDAAAQGPVGGGPNGSSPPFANIYKRPTLSPYTALGFQGSNPLTGATLGAMQGLVRTCSGRRRTGRASRSAPRATPRRSRTCRTIIRAADPSRPLPLRVADAGPAPGGPGMYHGDVIRGRPMRFLAVVFCSCSLCCLAAATRPAHGDDANAADTAAAPERPVMRQLGVAAAANALPTSQDIAGARPVFRRRFREPLAHTASAAGARQAAEMLLAAADSEPDRTIRWLLWDESRRLGEASGQAGLVAVRRLRLRRDRGGTPIAQADPAAGARRAPRRWRGPRGRADRRAGHGRRPARQDGRR